MLRDLDFSWFTEPKEDIPDFLACRISQSILREIFDVVEAYPVYGACKLQRGSEKLFMVKVKAPTEKVQDDFVG